MVNKVAGGWIVRGFAWGVACALGTVCQLAQAQFDPARATPQPPAIAKHFPDPAVAYATPGFAPGRQNFTLHAEEQEFLAALAKRSPRLQIQSAGSSQQGRDIGVAVLTGKRGWRDDLPTVLLIALQHGNEPASGEGALAVVQRLALEQAALLERVNVLVIPRANPDAAERFARETVNGTDVNRDHLLLRTPEAQAIAGVVRRYQPQVVVDLHEFTVGGRWVSKFKAVMRDDALLQAATVGNLHGDVAARQIRYLQSARQALTGAGQRSADYHTSSADPADLTVSMGGINADTGRNVAGLRHALSFLIETRGVGIGRAHFARRVHSQVMTAMALIDAAAADGAGLIAMQRDAGEQTAAAACRGEMTIAVRQTPQRKTLSFLDATTGEPRDIEVDWRSSLELTPVRQRARPCGYLLAADQTLAIQRLRDLGVEVTAVGHSDQPWQVEQYLVESDSSGQRQDGRGAISDGQVTVRMVRVTTEPRQQRAVADYVYVGMNQPLAALIAAALEPDTQNSFVANRMLALEGGKLLRVVQSPPADALRQRAAAKP